MEPRSPRFRLLGSIKGRQNIHMCSNINNAKYIFLWKCFFYCLIGSGCFKEIVVIFIFKMASFTEIKSLLIYMILQTILSNLLCHCCYVGLLLVCNSYMLSTHGTWFPILNKGLGIHLAFLIHEALFPQTLLVGWSLITFSIVSSLNI